MKIQTPPGMRDFYPAEMRLQNWLFDHWRSVARSFGFVEYEAPIFEFTELYTLKSGDELTAQAFRVSRVQPPSEKDTDRQGGKDAEEEARYAIRPEMTPSLARMVAARANALPRPIKWFSIPRMCRAERPQRGRLREFFQWNVDLLGVEEPLADAEVIGVAVEFLRRVGLSADEAVVRVSSRPLATALLASVGIGAGQVDAAFALVDKLDRLPPPEFARQWDEKFGAVLPATQARGLFERSDFEAALAGAARGGETGVAAANQFRELWDHLGHLGIADYCQFDLRIVRGLAYYTGPVFEIYPRRMESRALAGGGRYDSLTALLDGPKLPAVGFGMGDVTVADFLRDAGKLPDLAESLDVFVIDAEPKHLPAALQVVMQLRRAGLVVDYSFKRQAIGKQFKQASGRGARYTVIVGDEFEQGRQLAVKDLTQGRQATVGAEEFLSNPAMHLAALSAGN